jgi:chromate transporter
MLGKATFIDGWTWAIGLVSALLLLRFQVNATWVILGGATIGILLRGLQ